MNRREFVRRLAVSSTLFVVGATGVVELVGLFRRGLQQAQLTVPPSTSSAASASTASPQTIPAGYELVTQLTDLANKSSAYFNHPRYGSSILINLGGQWKAFSAICTHQPCTVQDSGSSIFCPCHGATFSPADGSVLGGPAPRPLPEYTVQILNGSLYVSDARVN